MMANHNVGNWHWTYVDGNEITNNYFQKSLVGISAKEGDVSAKITSYTILDKGDEEMTVGQSRNKTRIIYFLRLRLEYEGKKLSGSAQHVPGAWDTEESAGESKEDKSLSGSISILEFDYDTEKNAYVFEIDKHSDSPSKRPVQDLVRDQVVPQLREAIYGLRSILEYEVRKKYNVANGNSDLTNGTIVSTSATDTTESPAIPSNQVSTQKTKAFAKTSSGPVVNTTALTETAEFRTTAAELYQTFTDRSRLAAFTRSNPTVFEGAHPGGKFALFGGNVSGSFVELAEPTKIVQQWRLKQWPEGHFSRLEIHFDQNNSDGVTEMRVQWDGVPVGEEEATEKNWNDFYVKSIKITFGFGTHFS